VAPIGPALKERTAFYCAVCQPGPTPTDDGRVRRPLGAKADSSRTGYRRLR
jgi:endonuclease-8